MKSEKPREIAVSLLQRAGQEKEFMQEQVERALGRAGLAGPDRGFLLELVYGVIRWQRTLDWLLDQKTPVKVEVPLLRIILRLGLYQLFWLDRVPPHAAVHETVNLTKKFKLARKAAFVNAILRSCSRDAAAIRAHLQRLRQEEPAMGFSHPDWLVRRWEKAWGMEAALRLLQWNNAPPPSYARVNLLRTTPEQLQEIWKTEQVEFKLFDAAWIPTNLFWQISWPGSLTALPSFQQGLFYVQDPSTALAVQVLDPQEGEMILDLCAAPGGKTTYIAQRMGDKGLVSAQDLFPARLLLVEENCRRLGIQSVETSRPSEIVAPELTAKFDRVLVDAPCSNTGVLRRRVELRWRIRPEELVRLQSSQLELMNQAALQLKPGGVLVYSTCSLEAEENEEVTRQFAAVHPGWMLESEQRIGPVVEGVDGAYVARFRSQPRGG